MHITPYSRSNTSSLVSQVSHPQNLMERRGYHCVIQEHLGLHWWPTSILLTESAVQPSKVPESPDDLRPAC